MGMAAIAFIGPRNAQKIWHRRLLHIVLLVSTIAVTSVVSSIARDTDHPVTAAVVFIIAVLINGTVGGLPLGLLSAVCASVIYNFFIRFPVYQFGFDTIDDFVPLIALTLTAIISGVLSGRLADRARMAEQGRGQIASMLDFSSALQTAVTLEQVVAVLVENVGQPRAVQYLIARIEREYPFRQPEAWKNSIKPLIATLSNYIDEMSSAVDTRDRADMEMIVSLSIMAIERCELLAEEAYAEAARASEHLKTALLSSLSHDLRTPLAAISASIDGLIRYGDKIDSASRDEMQLTIRDQAAKLGRFIQQIMSMARLEAGLEAKDLEIVDVEETLGSVLSALGTQSQAREIVRLVEGEQYLTNAQPALLQQALYNVIDNALRYSEADSPVVVSLSHQGDMLMIGISDEGSGIDAKDLSHIFERFYRGSNSNDRSGQGLGLSIAKAFVEAMGGSIAVTSPRAAGRGTDVKFYLPRAEWQGDELING